jgi:hypothetical protein
MRWSGGGDGRDTTGLRLDRRPEPPSWESFPGVSDAFRAACAQLAGVFPAGMPYWFAPWILPSERWPEWRRGFAEQSRGGGGAPGIIEELGLDTWILQRNYIGVCTLLQAPAQIVLADQLGRVRVLEGVTPDAWLAHELDEGTRGQPPSAGPR